jgi:spermidine synthase
VLIAAEQPIALDLAALRAKVAQPAFAAPLRRVWRADDLESVLAHFVGDERLAADYAEHGEITTDDHPLIEYGFARMVGRGRFAIGELFATVKRTRAIPESFADIDFGRLLAVRRRDGLESTPLPDGIFPDPAPMLAVTDAFAHGNLEGAYRAYLDAPFDPRDTYELLAIATAEVQVGDRRAAELLDRLAPVLPTETAALRAIAAHAVHDSRAGTLAVEAFARLRTDPWVSTRVIDYLLFAAIAMAKADPTVGRVVFDALAEPFAVHVHDDQRIGARIVIAELIYVGADCVAALDPIEPYPPWRESLLDYRVRCYSATHHPRLFDAEADLARWRAEQ